jgi:hypothetical protein
MVKKIQLYNWGSKKKGRTGGAVLSFFMLKFFVFIVFFDYYIQYSPNQIFKWIQ